MLDLDESGYTFPKYRKTSVPH